MDLEKIEIAEHEFNILLYMKYDKGFCAKMCSCLRKKHFTSNLMGTMFQIARHFFQTFSEFPSKTTLSGHLNKAGENPDKFMPFLDALDNEEAYAELSKSDKKFIETTVVDFAKHAKMKEAILESYDLLAENKFGEINAKIQDALKFNIDVDLGVDLFDIDERYLRLEKSIEEKISTGFTNFDEKLGGGWCRKEIYCVLGPPGMGKSIFLPNFGARALKDGFNVVHYSLEMAEERVGLRYDGAISTIELRHLHDRIDEVKRKYDIHYPTWRLAPEKQTARLKIKEFPTGGASVLDIESHLEQLRTYEGFVPDVMIVDYGDIMKSARKTSNTYEEQGWIFRELRGLAIEYNCVVITATQARRDAVDVKGGTKAQVGMDQVADSMEKVRILDGLFSIVQSVPEKAQGKIKLYFAKNRNGPSGITITFNINYNNMLLTSDENDGKNKGKNGNESEKEDQVMEDEEAEDYMKKEINKGLGLDADDDYFDAKFNAQPKESTKITAQITEDE